MNKYLLLSLMSVSVLSCNKKPVKLNIPTIQVINRPESTYDFYPMKPGNYWVYGWYQGDTNRISNLLTYQFDSVYVRKDTVIAGNTYYILDDYPGGVFSGIYRDSSGYLVNTYGRIIFSTQNFTNVLTMDSQRYGSNLAFAFSWQMVNNVTATTPAGTFNTIQCRGSVVYSTTFALNPKFYQGSDYVKQIGLVLVHTYYQDNPDDILEWQLLRYHVQ